MPKSPNDVKKLVEDSKIEIIDLRFVDLPGVWQHFSPPARTLSDDMFTDGLGFDGSSIRGYRADPGKRTCSLFPVPETAFVNPVLQVPTLSMICSVQPVTRERYTRDPAHRQKAEDYLKSTGIADISYWGPEAEFYIFDDVRYDQSAQGGYYFIDSVEGVWNTGTSGEPQSGLQAAAQGRLLPLPAGPVPGSALRDDLDPGEGRRDDRGPSSRGRHGRSGRDRLEVRPADQAGRQPHVLQVHPPQRRTASGRS